MQNTFFSFVFRALSSAFALFGLVLLFALFTSVEVKAQSPYCAGLTSLSDPSGTIEDGSGPDNDYGDESDCSWLIEVPGASSISIVFDAFHIEADYDYLSIYDGVDANAPLLGEFTGNYLPGDIVTTSGSCFISFTSDGSVTDPGWSISYSSQTGGGQTSYCDAFTMLSEPSGFLSDGSGSDNYADNSTCTWLLFPPGSGTNITFTFTEIDLEEYVDFINIYDGFTSSSPLIGAFTGYGLPDAIESTTGFLYFEFLTNSSVNYGGWSGFWTSCSGAEPVISATGATSFCEGGSVTLVAPGGYSSYQWILDGNPVSGAQSFVYTATSQGDYTVEVQTSASCSYTSEPVTVVVNPNPIVFPSTGLTLCVNSQPAVLSGAWPEGGVFSGSGVFNNAFYPSTVGTGTYSIIYTYTNSYGCSSSASSFAVVNPLPTIVLPGLPPMCMDDQPIQLTNGIPLGGTYSGSNVYNGMFYPNLSNPGYTMIVYTLEDPYGCSNAASTVVYVDACMGFEEEVAEISPVVFPNPSNLGYFTLDAGVLNVAPETIHLYSILGEEVEIKSRPDGNSIKVSYSGLNPGFYLLSCNIHGKSIHKRIQIL